MTRSIRALTGASLIALLVAMPLAGQAIAQDTPAPDALTSTGEAPAGDAAAPAEAAASSPSEMSASGDAATDPSGTVEKAHKENGEVIAKLIALGAKPFHTLSVEEARKQPTPADAVKAVLEDQNKSTAPEAVAKTEDIKVEGAAGELDARVYWPEGAKAGEALPVVVYFHGGGFVVADLDVYDASPRAIANQAKALVVSVHYRQGPENKFPAAHDDAVAAYKYVVEHAHEWNGDSGRIAVAGESAGGNLAMNVAIAARDQKVTTPDAVIAVYPVAGKDMNTPSYTENEKTVPLGKPDMKWFVDNYLESMSQADDTRINLVAADLKDLPPTTIIAAELDPLRSEGEQLRDKLTEAGVDVTYQLWDGTTHEFFGMGAVVPEAKDAQALAGKELTEAFRQ
jgi:acetyl esterase